MMEQNQEQAQGGKTITIGNQLRKARKEANLSLDDIASDLLLKTDLIRSIEANEFENLSAPTYVKGYIRSYANLLGLDPAGMLEEYDSLDLEQPGWAVPESHKNPESKLRILSLSILLGLILVGLFIAWLVSSGYLNAPVEEEAVSSVDVTTDVVSTTELSAPVALVSQESRPAELDKPQPLVSIGTEPTEQAVEESPALVTNNSSDSNASNGSNTALVAAVTETLVTTTEAESVGVNEPEEGDSNQIFLTDNDMIRADAGSDQVIVILTEESWIEIRDASKFELLNGLFNPGDVKILTGLAPFQVFLGNANGVDLTINGIDYDVQSHKRQNNTARFALISSN